MSALICTSLSKTLTPFDFLKLQFMAFVGRSKNRFFSMKNKFHSDTWTMTEQVFVNLFYKALTPIGLFTYYDAVKNACVE